jgi:release factor glutamine methyltransferase
VSILKTLRNDVRKLLLEALIDDVDLETRLLITETLQISAIDYALCPEREVSEKEVERVMINTQKRAKRQPLSQIFTKKEFWSLNFKVTPDTLTPRPDSETLIEAVMQHFKDKEAELSILDLGTGTGCLLLSLLHEYPSATGVGIDISKKALSVAHENAKSLKLDGRATFTEGDWTGPLGKDMRFDIIICNPPYISFHERESLDPDVRDYEPASSLFAAQDGLAEYQRLAKQMGFYLSKNGLMVLEIGYRQADCVKKIFTSNGFNNITLYKDLGGRDRCLVIEK